MMREEGTIDNAQCSLQDTIVWLPWKHVTMDICIVAFPHYNE
jgi:hypothetical protein